MMAATTAATPSVPDRRNRELLDRSILGTDLTIGGGIVTFAAAPVMWLVIALVWAALPA